MPKAVVACFPDAGTAVGSRWENPGTYAFMAALSKAERLKLIRERLENPALKPFQTEADKLAAKSQKARRKGIEFQERIAADLQKIGKPFGFGEYDIYSSAVTGHGEDIVFSPDTWNRFGRLWIECKHYCRAFNVESTYKKHAQKCNHKQKHGSKGIPILVHRCDFKPILATLRQDDMIALSEEPPESTLHTEALVTVPWESVLHLLSCKVGARPILQSIDYRLVTQFTLMQCSD